MRQFLISAGRTIFNTRALYAVRRPGYEPRRGVTQSSTRDHPIEEPKMSSWEQTKEKISNKGKAGFGSDIQGAELPIVERQRIKGADRQATQHEKMEGMGNVNQKATLQSEMNAGIGINQSDATADQRFTESAKGRARDMRDLGKRNPEQMLRGSAYGKAGQQADTEKDMLDRAEKQRRADERAAKFPNMEKQSSMSKEKEHHENDKITDIINEEHGIPEVQNQKPGMTGTHEQHGLKKTEDDFRHEPKMRFDPARSYATNSNMFSEEQLGRRDTRATSFQGEKGEHGMVDAMKEKVGAAADWFKEKFGSEQPHQSQQTFDTKAEKTKAKQEVSEAEGKVQPQMRGQFGIPSGSPVGGIPSGKEHEKRTMKPKDKHDDPFHSAKY